MKKDSNQYRNDVRPGSVARWAFVGLLLAGFGIGFVYIKNNHVELGVQRGELEEEIKMLSRQIEEAEGWIARVEDRKNLLARLQRADSQLVRFAPSRVIKISAVDPNDSGLPGVREEEYRGKSELPEIALSGELAQNGR